jgi:hypothetical protein
VTLILNLINREHAIQVSDRCFTWFREDGAIEHTEDEHNKAVVFKDRFVFSYAGLGELPGCGRTDDWLAGVLHDFDISLPPRDHDQARVFATVAGRATEAFRHREMGRLHPARRRHLFVAICWGRFPPGFDRFESYLIVISNFHTVDGSELALPGDHFEVLPPQRLRDPDTTRLAWFGARVGASERRALNAIKRLNPDRPGFDRFESYLIVISNFHTVDGSELALPGDHFEVLPPRRLRDPDATRLAWFGARVGASERRALNAIKRLNPDRPGFAIAAIRLMAEQVRSVARRKPTVGRSLVAAAVPRDAAGVGAREHFPLAGRPARGHETFLYLPRDERSEVSYHPRFVGDAGVVTNFEARVPRWQGGAKEHP